jgi:uncharacterized protein (DUF2062 family)
MTEKKQAAAKPADRRWALGARWRDLLHRARHLRGDPPYVARGMAIGVFVALTPTIPFHTAIALALAFILKGSKPAAAIGAWVSNPFTVPIFYYGSYKTGVLLLGIQVPFNAKYESITQLLQLGLEATVAMLVGGIVLGLPAALIAYWITRYLVAKARARVLRRQLARKDPAQMP